MIPPNIITLGEHEAQVRAQSLEIIAADEALLDHLHIIEAAMAAAYDHVINRPDRTPDELTVQKLGIRLFNDLASALSQGLAGYYQQAFDTLRDLVELQFLFDDFSGDHSSISRWAGMERRERERQFSPRAVRERLDERYPVCQRSDRGALSGRAPSAASAALQFRRLVRVVSELLGDHSRVRFRERVRHAAGLIAPSVRASSSQVFSPIAEGKAPRENTAVSARSGSAAATGRFQIGEGSWCGLVRLVAGAAH